MTITYHPRYNDDHKGPGTSLVLLGDQIRLTYANDVTYEGEVRSIAYNEGSLVYQYEIRLTDSDRTHHFDERAKLKLLGRA